MPNQTHQNDIGTHEIVAMLHAKSTTMADLARKNRFDLLDVLSVVDGQKMYPNIANKIAQAIGTTKEMLWPSMYLATPQTNQPHTSIFVLRVALA